MDKTAVKLLRLYEHLCRAEVPLGVSALAAKLRLTKSNAHRILRTLTGLGYAQQTADGLYAPTLKGWELGTLVMKRLDVVQVAKPYLKELNLGTGESVYLATLNGTAVVYLDVLESRYPIRINSVIGGTAPSHCSASGKLLLALMPAAQRDALVSTLPLPRHNERTITDRALMAKELDRIVASGYALDNEEYVAGVACVAVPVRVAGEAVAAVAVHAATARLPLQRAIEFIPRLTEAAQRIATTFA